MLCGLEARGGAQVWPEGKGSGEDGQQVQPREGKGYIAAPTQW